MTQINRSYKVPRIQPAKGFRIHLLVFLLVTPAIWLVWWLSPATYPWPIWSTPAWAIGLLFHCLGVFVFRKKNNNQ